MIYKVKYNDDPVFKLEINKSDKSDEFLRDFALYHGIDDQDEETIIDILLTQLTAFIFEHHRRPFGRGEKQYYDEGWMPLNGDYDVRISEVEPMIFNDYYIEVEQYEK